MKEIIIHHEPVQLYKILKFEGLASSGGEAKKAITEELVTLNGKIEIQKRKKIVSGDEITFNDESYLIKLKAMDENK